jgi:hypothetical protein
MQGTWIDWQDLRVRMEWERFQSNQKKKNNVHFSCHLLCLDAVNRCEHVLGLRVRRTWIDRQKQKFLGQDGMGKISKQQNKTMCTFPAAYFVKMRFISMSIAI